MADPSLRRPNPARPLGFTLALARPGWRRGDRGSRSARRTLDPMFTPDTPPQQRSPGTAPPRKRRRFKAGAPRILDADNRSAGARRFKAIYRELVGQLGRRPT